MGAGIPTEKARDLRSSSRRLLSLLRADRVPVWWIVALATVGVGLTWSAPRSSVTPPTSSSAGC